MNSMNQNFSPLFPNQFGSIAPEDVDFRPFAAFPPDARLAILVGDPTKPGPYVIRVKAAGGARLLPHRHAENRIYTVISGVFYIGRGNQFEPTRLVAHAPGSVVVLPGNTHHFHWAMSGEYVTQITGDGPLGIDYVDENDDPRNARKV